MDQLAPAPNTCFHSELSRHEKPHLQVQNGRLNVVAENGTLLGLVRSYTVDKIWIAGGTWTLRISKTAVQLVVRSTVILGFGTKIRSFSGTHLALMSASNDLVRISDCQNLGDAAALVDRARHSCVLSVKSRSRHPHTDIHLKHVEIPAEFYSSTVERFK